MQFKSISGMQLFSCYVKGFNNFFRDISNNKYFLETFPQKSFSRFHLSSPEKNKNGNFSTFLFFKHLSVIFDKDAFFNECIICNLF